MSRRGLLQWRYGKYFVHAMCAAVPLLLLLASQSPCAQLNLQHGATLLALSCMFALIWMAIVALFSTDRHAPDSWRNILAFGFIFILLSILIDFARQCPQPDTAHYLGNKALLLFVICLLHRPVTWLTRKMFSFPG